MTKLVEQFGIGKLVDLVFHALMRNDTFLMSSFFLALILIYYRRKKDAKIYSFFSPYVFVFILLTFFPPLMYYMMKYFTSDMWAYARMSWLYLEIPTISAAIIMIASDMKKRERFFLLVMIGALCIFRNTGDDWIFAERYPMEGRYYYKMPEEVINIADYIMNENQEYLSEDSKNHIRVCVMGESKPEKDFARSLEGDWDYAKIMQVGIRSYASPIEVYYPKDVQVEQCQYIICENTGRYTDQVENIDYYEVYSTDRYIVLRKN